MDFITKYFNAEKAESLVFFGIGVIIISLGIAFLMWENEDKPFFDGIAYPFIVIALLQISVGIGIFFRSPKDITRVSEMMATAKERVQTEEIPRMEKVMQNFVIIRYTEVALLVISIGLFFLFNENPFVKGLAIGLFLQSVLMLLADYFAEKRGHEYLAALKNLF